MSLKEKKRKKKIKRSLSSSHEHANIDNDILKTCQENKSDKYWPNWRGAAND